MLLEKLSCSGNSLTELDLSQNTALTDLWCNENNLTTLDIRNGNNTNIVSFEVTDNPDLTCIFVDDADWSTSNWTNIDPTATFVETEAECDANPAEDKFRINSKIKVEKLEVFDIYGKLVKTFINQDNYSISCLESGVYLVYVHNIKGTQISKLIIK